MNKKDWCDRFLELPEDKRRQIKLTEKGLERRRYKTRRHFTKEQFVQYLKDNFVYTMSKLDKLNQTDINSPSRHFVAKYFGGWRILKKEVYGVGAKVFSKPENVIMLCVEYRIMKRSDYIEFRRKDSSLFPSLYEVYKKFGNWYNLKRLAMGRMVSSIYARYLALESTLGKKPTMEECRENGVEIDYLFQKISKENFEDLNEEIKKRCREIENRLKTN